jgi:hypothetical protein
MKIEIDKTKSIGVVKEEVDLEEKAFAEVLKKEDPSDFKEVIKANEIKENKENQD